MIIVGDSLTFGQGVRDDESYTAILGRLYETEPRSPEPHVINAGVNGWSTWHYMRWAETQLDKFQPDVLVVGLFLGNDMVISPPDVKAIPVPLENWTRDSALYSYGVEVYRKYLWKRVQASKRGMSLEELDEELEQYKGVIESDLQPNERKLLWKKNSIPHLATIRKACEEAHVEVVVLMIPSRASLLNEKLATKTVLFHKTLRDMLNAIDLRVIEVAEPLRKAGEAAWLPWDGGHLSPAGNRVVAKVLEVQLDALGLVPLPTAPAGGEL